MAGLKGLLALPAESDDELDEMDAEDADASEVGKQAAADDVMDAMKRGDKKAFAAALQDFVELCSSKSDYDDTE